mmetsp:Transcript_3578/g.16097  ORF Transcript_3578/g.16097 Transcript_3578/m.16097 type:complete len:87 (-) Transcript_3578:198-458(-)
MGGRSLVGWIESVLASAKASHHVAAVSGEKYAEPGLCASNPISPLDFEMRLGRLEGECQVGRKKLYLLFVVYELDHHQGKKVLHSA